MLRLTSLAVFAITAQALAGGWIECTDAGEFPAGDAQDASGTGALTMITGATSSGADDFCDAYRIEITDPLDFYATTSAAWDPAAAATWDTRLFLFAEDGTALLANDDVVGTPGAQSYLSDPATHPGPVDPTASSLVAGTYVLVITGWANDPEDATDTDLFAIGSEYETLFGPDPGAGPFAHWENDHALTQSGAYTIALAGAALIDGPPTCLGDLDCNGMVDGADLGLLLGAWGGSGPADLDGSGVVDGADLGLLLGAWGEC